MTTEEFKEMLRANLEITLKGNRRGDAIEVVICFDGNYITSDETTLNSLNIRELGY